ncbi:hypothetical protein ABLE92_24555 [Gordonia sp. VNQ95]|jgi:predicted nucleotidyltransferase|uniref:hypothetical protein n=1 Tax=Gordonia sp. VNQ95 TaxID=3156619 RepID=UPI0032B61041
MDQGDRAYRGEHADIARVVAEIADVIDPAQIMLVGARCRDILHARLADGARFRATNDTDLAVAIPDWSVFEELHARFGSTERAWQRMMIAGIPTDVVPFGALEEPRGTISREIGRIELNVHGFADVFDAADVLALNDALRIRIPTLPGYAVLKAHAWLDRLEKYEYKDAQDLALCIHWTSLRSDDLWGDAFWALEREDFDLHRGAAALLAAEMLALLSVEEAAVLRDRMGSMNVELLAQQCVLAAPGWPTSADTRRAVVAALVRGITDGPQG